MVETNEKDKPLLAEVIAIGDELTTGQRLDTNTQWLSQRLIDAGLDVHWHTTIGDTLEAGVAAFRAAGERSDVALVTGGLGPTADDLTREALAEAAGVGLCEDAESLAAIEQRFASRGYQMPDNNRRQAFFPEGSSPISNPDGTAPGVDATVGRCRLFALPGVPSEMRGMWASTVAPELAAMRPASRVTRRGLLRCFGVGESRLESMLPELFVRGREPLVGITASDATITLRVVASGADETACFAAMEPTFEHARRVLGDLVYAELRGDGAEPELHDALVDLLAERGGRVASCEAMTTGLVGDWLATADRGRGVVGESTYRGAVATPLDEALGLVASQAEGLLGRADHAVVVGPPPTDPDQGIAVAAASPGGVVTKAVPLIGATPIHRPLVAKHALNLLRLELIKLSGASR